jgi:hypothetical protein
MRRTGERRNNLQVRGKAESRSSPSNTNLPGSEKERGVWREGEAKEDSGSGVEQTSQRESWRFRNNTQQYRHLDH